VSLSNLGVQKGLCASGLFPSHQGEGVRKLAWGAKRNPARQNQEAHPSEWNALDPEQRVGYEGTLTRRAIRAGSVSDQQSFRRLRFRLG